MFGGTLPAAPALPPTMTRATLRITLPAEVWIGDLSRAYPDARVRILAALADGPDGVGLAEIESAAVDDVLAEMRAYEAVTDLSVLRTADESALVQFETSLPLLLLAARDSGVPLEMPFDIVDGEALWEIAAPRERLSELGTHLETFGVPFTVERVGQAQPSDPLLTDRQERLLAAAMERGYYDTPRGCTLTDLADSEGFAKSTVSEVLHRAEGHLVRRYFEESEAREPASAVPR